MALPFEHVQSFGSMGFDEHLELDSLLCMSACNAIADEPLFKSCTSPMLHPSGSSSPTLENFYSSSPESSVEDYIAPKAAVRNHSLPSHVPSHPSSLLRSISNGPPSSASQFLLGLSEEERVMMEAEGVKLPSAGPLSASQEREFKRLRRKIKNKLSAKDSRRRRKEYMSTLEDENQELRQRLDAASEENAQLAKHIEHLTGTLRPRGTSGAGSNAAYVMILAMLCLSGRQDPARSLQSPATADLDVQVKVESDVSSMLYVDTNAPVEFGDVAQQQQLSQPLKKLAKPFSVEKPFAIKGLLESAGICQMLPSIARIEGMCVLPSDLTAATTTATTSQSTSATPLSGVHHATLSASSMPRKRKAET